MDENIGVGVGPAERAQDGGGAGPTPEPRRRMSARRKHEAVLRLLRGEDLELLSRELVGDGRRAEQLAGGFPRFGRGVAEEPVAEPDGFLVLPPFRCRQWLMRACRATCGDHLWSFDPRP